jgi:hypothetical protein
VTFSTYMFLEMKDSHKLNPDIKQSHQTS